MIRLVIAAALLAVPATASALPPRLPPTDSCAGDRDFVAFRNRLRIVVARRDAAGLLRLASDDIANQVVNGELGRGAFARAWGLDRHPATSRLWTELGAVLRLGCGHDGRGFLWAPALRGTGEEDLAGYPFKPMVAVGPAAFLRVAPSARSRAITRLRWDVVGPTSNDGHSIWVNVRLANGRHGFVRRDQLRSIGDYSAMFQYRHARWEMIAFTRDDCECPD